MYTDAHTHVHTHHVHTHQYVCTMYKYHAYVYIGDAIVTEAEITEYTAFIDKHQLAASNVLRIVDELGLSGDLFSKHLMTAKTVKGELPPYLQ